MKKANPKNNDNCPVCMSSVLHFDGDQFCVECDWSTMLADVQSGRFERRLGLTTPTKHLSQSSVTFIDADAIETEHEDIVTVSAS